MRLTLVISSLGRGGAERIISVLAGAWAKQGVEVMLVTFDDKEAPAYAIDPRVALCALKVPNELARNSVQRLYRNLLRVIRLRRLIGRFRPEIVISFLSVPNVVSLLATRGMHIPVIVSERANPRYDKVKRIWKPLRRFIYPSADALVCQTSAMVEQLRQTIKVPGYAIPNPVELPSSFSAETQTPASPGARTIIGMGRLVPQKGFDLLLEAFSRIAGKHPQWSIKVLGNGPDKERLEAQAESLGLKNRVSFVGAVSDPFPVLHAADLFVFSSRFEGFGNALIEAMACRLPVISFDCPAGPADIIRDGVDGVLVPREDVAALATAMDRLMSDPAERERLARRAPEVLTRFSLKRVLGMWEALFNDVLRARKK